jgi:hypothetical protein
MFETGRAAAEAQLDNRAVTFKKCHGYVSPDKLRDRYAMQLAGFMKYTGNEAWFNRLIDSDEFKKYFDEHTLIDWDDIAPEDTPAPSPLMERAWASFSQQ